MEPHRCPNQSIHGCSQTAQNSLLFQPHIHAVFFAVADVVHSLWPGFPTLCDQPGLTLERTATLTPPVVRQPETDPTIIPTNVVRR